MLIMKTERPGLVEDYVLSEIFNDLQGSQPVPFGDAVLSILGAHLSTFSYHEMLISKPLHAGPKDDVISIHAVSTASHHELGSFDTRFHQLQQIAEKTKGIVVYSDQRGCGGDRTYGDGCAMVFAYGQLVAQGHQFSLEDVEVITAVIELEHDSACQVTQLQSNGFVVSDAVNCLAINFDLSSKLPKTIANGQNDPIEPKSFGIEEQIANGPACWLWDYLRRSHAAGFVVPLSGGIDSGCTATIVFSMCRLVIKALRNGNKQVAADVQRIVGMKDWLPDSPQELCNHILHTIYMGMSGHSSEQTRSRACRLAQDLGAHHTDMNIDSVYQAETDLFRQYLGHTPTFDSELPAENLALQNIQARVRMVTAYYFAQMLPSTRGRSGGGTLLVLSSINVEECLRGSLTKHDCSSADLSPIGSFSKMHIRDFIRWATISFSLPILDEFLTATSRAELEPERFNQHDFKDMGMTHDELWMFGKLRKDHRLGPLSMFQKVLLHWRGQKAFGRLLTS
jgi:NAD+ synthase (glutamine-hydrolysing)